MNDDLKMMFERILFSIGMILNLLLNIILLPVHIGFWICKKNKWPIIWPKAMQERLEMYKRHYKDVLEKGKII